MSRCAGLHDYDGGGIQREIILQRRHILLLNTTSLVDVFSRWPFDTKNIVRFIFLNDNFEIIHSLL